jgi:hypothetical protein
MASGLVLMLWVIIVIQGLFTKHDFIASKIETIITKCQHLNTQLQPANNASKSDLSFNYSDLKTQQE